MKKCVNKTFCLIMIISIIFSSLSLSAIASDNRIDDNVTVISKEEINTIEIAMDIRSIGGNVVAEILYDHNDLPSYFIGLSDLGYLILARNSLTCMESGEANKVSPNVKTFEANLAGQFSLDNSR